MARKSPILSHQPSNDEDETEESSSKEEEEEEEEEEGDTVNSSDKEMEAGSSDDEGQNLGTKSDPKSISRGNGSNSDADSEESPSDYVLRPIGNGSVSSAKRSRGEIQGSPLKRSKSSRVEAKKSAPSPGGGSGGCINRLWSDEDEVAVLNGMIEFKTVKGLDPNADMEAFRSFIKGKLQVDFSRDQLRTKIARMKKRFLNAVKKGEEGEEPVFSKQHEVLVFEKSKKTWGENEDVNKEIENVENGVESEEDGEGEDFWSKYPNIGASIDHMKENFPSFTAPVAGVSLLKEKLSFIGNVKAKELDDKWKQLAVEETELTYKILLLMKEQVRMALDK